MNKVLLRNIPLDIAVPQNYKLFPDTPEFGNYLWTTQKSYDLLKSTGTNDPDEGMLQLKIATDVGYDGASDQFICGPGCNEKTMAQQLSQLGLTIKQNERKLVNDVPLWFIQVANKDGSQGYLAYIATLVDTNAVVLRWSSPPKRAEMAAATWREIRSAMENSKPDPAWKAARVKPARKTPLITPDVKLPAATERVAKLVDAVRRAAATVEGTVDLAGARDGLVTARSHDGVTITLRFVDFGEEIVTATSVAAAGSASDNMQQFQKRFFEEFVKQAPRDYPIVGSDDMTEQMVLLPMK